MDIEVSYSAVWQSPIGWLGICVTPHGLSKIDFLSQAPKKISRSTDQASDVISCLEAYFKNAYHIFDVPIALDVSDYHRQVLNALKEIPVGSVSTYGALAKKLNTSARAVGGACRRNPLPLIIPCHRVVSASGLGGFAGATEGRLLEIKQWLLNHERA